MAESGTQFNGQKPPETGDLLGYHLGLIDDPQRAQIEAAYGNPEDLLTARHALQRLLSALDADQIQPPSPHLVQNILDHVERSRQGIIPLPQSSGGPEVTDDVGTGPGPLLSLRELISLAAAILLFVGIFVPGYRTARNASQKVACANNLRQIGNGYAAYAEMNEGQWPFAGSAPKEARWFRTGADGPPSVRNSRHIYRLARGRLVPASAFYCPSRQGDAPFQSNSPEAYDDFPDPRNISYASHIVTTPWNRRTILLQMPIVAGMTPLVDQHRRLIRNRLVSPNSTSHGRPGGQNVLHVNSSVGYYASPNVGVEHDDIYRVLGVQKYTGLERPRSRSDAFLVP